LQAVGFCGRLLPPPQTPPPEASIYTRLRAALTLVPRCLPAGIYEDVRTRPNPGQHPCPARLPARLPSVHGHVRWVRLLPLAQTHEDQLTIPPFASNAQLPPSLWPLCSLPAAHPLPLALALRTRLACGLSLASCRSPPLPLNAALPAPPAPPLPVPCGRGIYRRPASASARLLAASKLLGTTFCAARVSLAGWKCGWLLAMGPHGCLHPVPLACPATRLLPTAPLSRPPHSLPTGSCCPAPPPPL
jgi:hypothetical protein